MNPSILDPFIESCVEAFELAVAQRPDTRIKDFLPERDHAKYRETLTELIRVDLDMAWERDDRRSLQQYRDHFPNVFSDPDSMEQLTFEEFRQRRQAGERVKPEEYESSYCVDTRQWSEWTHTENAGTWDVEPEVGSRWHGFELVRRLGRGSFGVAFLARQSDLSNRDVVLKFSPLESNEAQRLAELQHTNIVPVFSVHDDAGRSVMCMPYLGDTTLANLAGALNQSSELPTRGELICHIVPANDQRARGDAVGGEALDYYRGHSYVESVAWLVARLAEAMHHSHRRGILHCDIKPANVMLREDGEPMLIDFNLAVHADTDAKSRYAGGTLPYMAPEQMIALDGGSTALDARADIYGLGVVLYQLLTGRVPWKTPDSRDDLAAWIAGRREPYERATRINSQATPAMDAIVKKCLAFEPSDRYLTAAQLCDDLRHHLDNQPLTYAKNSSWRESFAKWRRRNPWLLSLTSAAVVATACVVVSVVAWLVRDARLASDKATVALGQFAEQAAVLRPTLALAAIDPNEAELATRKAESLARHYHIDQEATTSATWHHLDRAEQQRWRRESSALCAFLAAIQMAQLQQADDLDQRQSLLDSARVWNDRAARWGGLEPMVVEQQRTRIEAVHGNVNFDAHDLQNVASPSGDGIHAMLAGLQRMILAKPREAAFQFRRATQSAPTDATNWLMLAEALMQMEEYSQAEASLDVAVSLLPDSPLPLFRRALCRMAHGRYQAAVDDFSEGLVMQPDRVEARLNRALAYHALEEFDKSLEDIDAAIAAGCEQTRAHFIRARLRLALGDMQGAAAARRRGLALEPTDENSWIARGHAKLGSDPQAALADFQSALAENTLSTNALQNIAHVLSERLQSPEAAIKSLSDLLSIRPSDRMARAGRGVLHGRTGNLDAAIADARYLAEAEQLKPLVQYQVGCIYALCCQQRPKLESPALAALAESFALDRQFVEIARTDPDLAAIRGNTAFINLIEAATELNKVRDADD